MKKVLSLLTAFLLLLAPLSALATGDIMDQVKDLTPTERSDLFVDIVVYMIMNGESELLQTAIESVLDADPVEQPVATREPRGLSGLSGGKDAKSTEDEDVVEGDLGPLHVKFMGARLDTSYDGKDCLVITFEWSHTSDEPQNFSWAFDYTAYQDGIECEEAYVMKGDDLKNTRTNIKAGVTIESEVAFVLSNLVSPVEVELSEFLNFDSNKKIEKTYDITGL